MDERCDNATPADADSENGGTCGKMGQAVPVMDGLPTIKISEITVGGTES